jgi:hypothetical protein
VAASQALRPGHCRRALVLTREPSTDLGWGLQYRTGARQPVADAIERNHSPSGLASASAAAAVALEAAAVAAAAAAAAAGEAAAAAAAVGNGVKSTRSLPPLAAPSPLQAQALALAQAQGSAAVPATFAASATVAAAAVAALSPPPATASTPSPVPPQPLAPAQAVLLACPIAALPLAQDPAWLPPSWVPSPAPDTRAPTLTAIALSKAPRFSLAQAHARTLLSISDIVDATVASRLPPSPAHTGAAGAPAPAAPPAPAAALFARGVPLVPRAHVPPFALRALLRRAPACAAGRLARSLVADSAVVSVALALDVRSADDSGAGVDARDEAAERSFVSALTQLQATPPQVAAQQPLHAELQRARAALAAGGIRRARVRGGDFVIASAPGAAAPAVARGGAGVERLFAASAVPAIALTDGASRVLRTLAAAAFASAAPGAYRGGAGAALLDLMTAAAALETRATLQATLAAAARLPQPALSLEEQQLLAAYGPRAPRKLISAAPLSTAGVDLLVSPGAEDTVSLLDVKEEVIKLLPMLPEQHMRVFAENGFAVSFLILALEAALGRVAPPVPLLGLAPARAALPDADAAAAALESLVPLLTALCSLASASGHVRRRLKREVFGAARVAVLYWARDDALRRPEHRPPPGPAGARSPAAVAAAAARRLVALRLHPLLALHQRQYAEGSAAVLAAVHAAQASANDPDAVEALSLLPVDAPSAHNLDGLFNVTLGARLTLLLTSQQPALAVAVGDFLFTLCGRNKDEFCRYVGMGLAAGTLVRLGLFPGAAHVQL